MVVLILAGALPGDACGAPGGQVLREVNTQVAPLAGCQEVLGRRAEWGAPAEVGCGQSDLPPAVLRVLVVALLAPLATVEAALACALAAVAGSYFPHPFAHRPPGGRVGRGSAALCG